MGERVLIHAAGSGVGTAAIQLACATGAIVYGTSRTPEKLERARDLGLDVALAAQDFATQVQHQTAGQGVQLILDFMGASYLAQNIQALANWGRIVVLATLGGSQGQVPLGLLMAKRLTIKGVTLRTRTLEEKMAATSAFTREVLPLLANGTVKPVIERVYPLHEIAAAHTTLAANQTFGKLILTLDER